MKVLHLIASVNPEEGGPIAYARNMAHERHKEGDETLFISADAADAEFVRTFPYPLTTTSRTRKGFEQAVQEHARECDVAIVHGLWNPASIGGYKALKNLGIPWVVFPHGMLDPYFRKIKPVKHMIKQVYWTLWQGRVLSEAARVLFTSAEEQRLAQGAFRGHGAYDSTVIAYCAADQVTDGSVKPANLTSYRPYFLYLSRIHEKKGLDLLLEAFAKFAAQAPEFDLVIAGPDKTNPYADMLKKRAKDLGVDSRVIWYGTASGDNKKALFKHAEAFVLTSHQENFGQVVAEALSAGLPVLISDKVNIWREIKAAGAGFVSTDTLLGAEELLSSYLSLTPQKRDALRNTSRTCYEARFSVASAYDALKTQLEQAVNSGKQSVQRTTHVR